MPAAAGRLSLTECRSCMLAEMPRGRRAVYLVLELLFPTRPSPIRLFGASWQVMLGGGRPRSWYERHLERYTATGDPAELQRMLRHVDETA